MLKANGTTPSRIADVHVITLVEHFKANHLRELREIAHPSVTAHYVDSEAVLMR